ncbi:MAG: ParB/RepB/Spo0J family partition protein [Candidatus Thermoplasmatota archaeon]
MTSFLKAYFNPEKYAIKIPIDKVVADKKIDETRVKQIKKILKSSEEIKPIVVVKHPKKDYYAVLDGHHRYWAQKEIGLEKIKCAIVEDDVGIGFFMTKNGILQPNPKFTKYIRIPLKRFYSFMSDFIKNPELLIKKQKNNKFGGKDR